MAASHPPDALKAVGEDHAAGHRHRLRERFSRAGASALQNYELLLIPDFAGLKA